MKTIQLYHGNSFDLLPDLDLDKSKVTIITDPPYDIHAEKGGGCYGNRQHYKEINGFTDGGVDYSFLKGFGNWVVFCSWMQLKLLLHWKSRQKLLIWLKTNPLQTGNNKYLPDVEYIVHTWEKGRLFGSNKDKATVYQSSIYNPTVRPEWKRHPNEKPLGLMIKLVKLSTQEGDIVLDPFMGTGTTGVACRRLGRRFIGIELNRKWYRLAKRRIRSTDEAYENDWT